jgi:hypothetical protein
LQNFEADISTEISEVQTGGLSALLGSSADTSSDVLSSTASFTDIVNALTSAVSTAYSTLVPAADVANALLTTLPTYDVTLFLDHLEAGSLIDAIGYPIAADEALVPLAGLIDFAAIANAAQTNATDLGGVF